MAMRVHGRDSASGPASGVILLLVASAALLAPASAAALRCNGDLVGEGDPAFEVRQACGKPDYVLPLYAHAHGHAGPREELWYYNFGPHRLMRELRMRDGRLRAIRTPDRGFAEDRGSGDCTPNDVFTGMTAYELLVTCGEPVQREARRLFAPHRRNGVVHGHPGARVEDWYYPFGERYLDRRVRLVDGRVSTIETVD